MRRSIEYKEQESFSIELNEYSDLGGIDYEERIILKNELTNDIRKADINATLINTQKYDCYPEEDNPLDFLLADLSDHSRESEEISSILEDGLLFNFPNQDLLIIRHIYVGENFRRLGFASGLLDNLYKRIWKQENEEVFICGMLANNTDYSNKEDLIKFYNRKGFLIKNNIFYKIIKYR
jgi:GNAT superfamily N-acetyltransferase